MRTRGWRARAHGSLRKRLQLMESAAGEVMNLRV
jgi:hypothetical protein